MRPALWQPPEALAPAEQAIVKRIKRAKLFVFLRLWRHALFSAAFAGHARRGRGRAVRCDSLRRDVDRGTGRAIGVQTRRTVRQRLFKRGCDPRSERRPYPRRNLDRNDQRLEYGQQLGAFERAD